MCTYTRHQHQTTLADTAAIAPIAMIKPLTTYALATAEAGTLW